MITDEQLKDSISDSAVGYESEHAKTTAADNETQQANKLKQQQLTEAQDRADKK